MQQTSGTIQIQWLASAEITPYFKNAKEHPKKTVGQSYDNHMTQNNNPIGQHRKHRMIIV